MAADVNDTNSEMDNNSGFLYLFINMLCEKIGKESESLRNSRRVLRKCIKFSENSKFVSLEQFKAELERIDKTKKDAEAIGRTVPYGEALDNIKEILTLVELNYKGEIERYARWEVLGYLLLWPQIIVEVFGNNGISPDNDFRVCSNAAFEEYINEFEDEFGENYDTAKRLVLLMLVNLYVFPQSFLAQNGIEIEIPEMVERSKPVSKQEASPPQTGAYHSMNQGISVQECNQYIENTLSRTKELSIFGFKVVEIMKTNGCLINKYNPDKMEELSNLYLAGAEALSETQYLFNECNKRVDLVGKTVSSENIQLYRREFYKNAADGYYRDLSEILFAKAYGIRRLITVARFEVIWTVVGLLLIMFFSIFSILSLVIK